MSINKVVYGSKTLIDLTNDTVTASALVKGYKAHDKSGNVITGIAKSETTMQAEIEATWEASY
jgi:hypothetical protein